MKRIIALVAFCLVLTACAQTTVVPESTDVETTSTVVDATSIVPTLKDKIEDSASYTLVTDKDEKASVVPVCDDFSTAYSEKVQNGDVKVFYLYKSKDHLYDLKMYMIPNYELEKSGLEKVSGCGELGANSLITVIGDNSVWGHSSCTGGAEPSVSQPGYEDYKACSLIEVQLNDYLGEK